MFGLIFFVLKVKIGFFLPYATQRLSGFKLKALSRQQTQEQWFTFLHEDRPEDRNQTTRNLIDLAPLSKAHHCGCHHKHQ